MDLLSLLNFQLACHVLIFANILFLRRRKIVVRRWWERPELKLRDKLGAYKKIFLYFKKKDHEQFYNFVGMTVEQFQNLNNLTRRKLKKSSYRKSLHPELRLSAVLNFLVHGGSATKQSWFFLIGRSTMYKIIPEVCKAISDALEGCTSLPKGDEFLEKAREFYDLYDFPNVIGIIDGKHFPIKAPPESGSWFRNFKQTYSINMMAACDANGKIIWASVGDFGSKNDASTFVNSELGIALAKKEIDFPPSSVVPHTKTECPFFFLADGGFALDKYLLTPFRKTKSKPMPLKFKIFNIRLQHPRKTIERVFGIMCKKWRVLEKKLDFKMETTDSIIYTIVHLYNYTFNIDETQSDIESSGSSDGEGDSDNSSNFNTDSSHHSSSDSDNDEHASSTTSQSSVSSKSDVNKDNQNETSTDDSGDEFGIDFENAQATRDFLAEYFMSSKGNVVWQWDKL